jgi:hypothetical protein
MTLSEIAEKLCYYDTRNPDGVKSYMTEEEIKEEGYTATSKHDTNDYLNLLKQTEKCESIN